MFVVIVIILGFYITDIVWWAKSGEVLRETTSIGLDAQFIEQLLVWCAKLFLPSL